MEAGDPATAPGNDFRTPGDFAMPRACSTIAGRWFHLDGRDDRPAEMRPARVLQSVRKESKLTIDVEGELPDRPRRSASFRDATVADVLKWFAERTSVRFRADPPNRLRVIVPAPGE